MSLCGIDIGTTGCKATIYSHDGRCLAYAYREYPANNAGDGYAELDSQEVWQLVCDALQQVVAEASHDPIEAISVSSLGEAMVPVTADRRILDNSILCSDTRGQEYVDELLSRITLEEFYDINPNLPGIGYSMPKLRWIKDNKPGVFERADYFLTWADFICFMLGGEPCCCSSLASRTLLYDMEAGDWSADLLELCELSDIRDKLAPIVPAGQIVGCVATGLAEKLGLKPNVRIVSGGHDQCCNALGAGVEDTGSAVYGIGTFACITPVFDKVANPQTMLHAGLGIEEHVVEDKFVSFIYNQAGSLVRWFRDTFAACEAAMHENIYERLDGELPADPTPLFVLPYFEPTGPPKYVSNSSGMIIGLRSNTSRGEILKAIMESVTFYLSDACGVLNNIGCMPEMFVATGGGSNSDTWLSIKADIFGIPFIRKTTTECTSLGAAMLAGKGIGVEISCEHFNKPEKVFDPNPARHEIYKEKLGQYRQIAEKMI